MQGWTHGMSDGVTGSEGGGGRLIKVGALDIATAFRVLVLVRNVLGRAVSSSSAAKASEEVVHTDVGLSCQRGVVRVR